MNNVRVNNCNCVVGGEMELCFEKFCAMEAADISWSFKSFQTITSGRTGIKVIAKMLKKRFKRDVRVLLPSYLCPSVFQPFQEEDILVDFYRICQDLTVDLDDLTNLMKDFHPNSVLLINYFGFPVNKVVSEIIHELSPQCWIIEDCVQGSLVESIQPVVGQIGDFVITSFRKYLPIPDGGLIINRTDMTLPSLPRVDSQFVQYRLLGKWLRYEFVQDNCSQSELEKAYITLFAVAEEKLDMNIPLLAMSRISERMLSNIDLLDVMRQRRHNYSFLLDAFTKNSLLQSIGKPVLPELPSGVSPLVFPIRVMAKLRDVLRQQLIGQRLFCPIHWQLPAVVKESRFLESYRLSSEILGLPIDQRYDETAMACLIDRLLLVWDAIT